MPFESETDLVMPSEPQPAGLIDLQIPGSAKVAPRLVLVFIIIVALAAFALASGSGIGAFVRTHPLIYGMLLGLAITVWTRLGPRLWRPRILARTQEMVARFKERPIRDLVDELFGNRGRVLQRTYLKTMARVLARQGRAGVTIRSGPPKLATAIDPITVTFEPRLLDEADASTVQLLDSTTRAEALGVTQESLAGRLAGRRLTRNIRMAGGWLMLIVFAIEIITAAVESFETWRVTWRLMIWSVLLIAMIFGFGRPGLSGWRVQWLLVPGGVMIRKAGLGWRKPGLHLFARRHSVLLVHRLTRNQSFVCVCDGESQQDGTATPREVVFLLRAWLSLLPPPAAQKLTDWL